MDFPTPPRRLGERQRERSETLMSDKL